MAKPAERLRNVSNSLEYDGQAIKAKKAADCAALLDECERVLADVLDCAQSISPEMTAAYDAARATLAKLRGEA